MKSLKNLRLFMIFAVLGMSAVFGSCGSSVQQGQNQENSPYYCDAKFTFEKHKYIVFKADGSGQFNIVHDPECFCNNPFSQEWLDSYETDVDYEAKLDSIMNLIEHGE